jgi:hypothetical protein
MRKVDADIFLANHANFFNLAGEANAFVDAGALQAFNAQSEREFDGQLAKEQVVAARDCCWPIADSRPTMAVGKRKWIRVPRTLRRKFRAPRFWDALGAVLGAKLTWL